MSSENTDNTKVDEDEQEQPAPKWEAELDVYPLRKPSEDPRWAVWTVWIWVVFAVLSLLFTITLIVLGFFYD